MIKEHLCLACHETSDDLISEILSRYTANRFITSQLVRRNHAYSGCTITERLDEFRKQVYNE